MRNIIFGLFALSTFSFGATGDNSIYFKGEFTPIATYQIEQNDKVKDDIDEAAYGFYIEKTQEISNGVEAGLGIGYQWNGSLKYDIGYDGDSLPEMCSVPLYATIKVDLPGLRTGQWTPYLKGDLGYSFNDLKDNENFSYENGLYYSLGFGLEIEELSIEIAYKVNTGELNNKKTHSKYDVESDRIMLGAALKFDLN